MPSYSYKALSVTGKMVKDSVEASSEEAALNSIRAAGFTVYEIKEQSALTRDIDIPFLGKPSAKDMAIFCRQFVAILKAGVSVADILSMLGQQTENAKLAKAIRDMQADVEKGETLAASMGHHRDIFDSMLINMIAAGEESGNLEKSFNQMEVYYEKAKKTKSAVGKVMIYPCVLLVVMIVILIVMMTNIIPTFLETFESLNAELPTLTLMVMAVCDWFTAWWWLLVIIIVGLVVGCTLFNKTDKGRHFFGFISRKIPVVKNLVIKSACSTFCRTVSLLLASGLNLTEALELTAPNMKNIWFEDAVMDIRSLVAVGMPLNGALREVKLFPSMVVNMTAIGEESGDLESMLEKAADYYDEEVQAATDKVLGLLEPFIILFMAVFVIIIVLAIYLPMMNMTAAYDQYL